MPVGAFSGDGAKTVSVRVPADAIDEQSEFLKLRLSFPAGAALGNYSARGTVVDDDSGLKTPRPRGVTGVGYRRHSRNSSRPYAA